MTHIPEDLRTFIIATTPVTSLVSSRVHYNHIPENAIQPHVWFRVSSDT
jgi:hypothetical protein